jgi:nanoRNase/pAp phosphatase (c-di-AMP/oligoRNAs hydrolase)
MWGLRKQNTVFAIGKSILDRGSPVDVGSICLRYGGGGHRAAGTCQIANDQAETVKAELIATLTRAPSMAEE